MVVRQDILTGPEITPITGGVLDHATIVEGIAWQEPGVGLYESFNCMLTDRRATWPCPVAFLAPPVQAALATSAVGGTVAADTYFFTVTAINAQGETLESNEQTIVTTGATSTITIDWAGVPGATGYRVYGTGGAAGSETFLVQVGAPTIYVWTGAPAIGVAQPPSTNTAEVVPVKTFDSPSWPEGQRVVLYGGVECKRFGGEDVREEALAEIRRVFEARESFGVERALLETVLQGAVDITPSLGTPVSPRVGLALLEANAAGSYAGLPTLHMPRTIASLLAADTAVESQGGKLYTKLGSKVAAGGGYDYINMGPDGSFPSNGELWLYASGEVSAIRGDIIAKDTLDLGSNENLDLVERPYVLAVDCYTAAVLVSIE